MKPGSLVATKFSTFGFLLDAMKGGYKFVGTLPSPDQIYTCKALYPHSEDPNYVVIEFEEFKVVPINGKPSAWLNANYWYEVQPPMDLTELLEETKHSQLKMQI